MALAEAGARGRLLLWPRVVLFGDSITEVAALRQPLRGRAAAPGCGPDGISVPPPQVVGPMGSPRRRGPRAGPVGTLSSRVELRSPIDIPVPRTGSGSPRSALWFSLNAAPAAAWRLTERLCQAQGFAYY